MYFHLSSKCSKLKIFQRKREWVSKINLQGEEQKTTYIEQTMEKSGNSHDSYLVHGWASLD